MFTSFLKELTGSSSAGSSLRGSLRRSTTVAPSTMEQPKNNDSKYLVKRLAHYSSMADALVGGAMKKQQKAKSDLNASDKENTTPDRNYR